MRIAVLGLGEMGARMALNLLRAGHRVSVWNRSPGRLAPLLAAGAIGASTPAEAAADAEFALSVVRDDEASRAIWLGEQGALCAVPADAVAIESSTLSLAWTRELAAVFRSRERALLDAPVVGSRAQAEAGTLIHLVGGDATAFARAAGVFEILGASAHRLGGSGAGAALKLVVNALLGVQVALLAEMLGVIERCGLDPAAAAEALIQTPPCSPAGKAVLEGMLARRFNPAFPVDLMEKDLDYIGRAAAEGQASLAAAARSIFRQAQAEGLGGENMTAVAKLYVS